jgi:PhzF family phenazine biosynthesis protein
VDAFTDTLFKGNPAGVCLLDEPGSKWRKMSIARKMNLSETAFLYGRNGIFYLRWFTPKVEVQLCGHATLASAHILLEERKVPEEDSIAFEPKSGRLPAQKRGGGWRVERSPL